MLERFDYVVRPQGGAAPLPARVEALLTANGHPATCAHVFAVAKTVRSLAERFGLPAEPCVDAALLHDVSAVIRPADMLALTQESGAYIDEAERLHPFLLHQRVSRTVAQEDFGVDDERVLRAVECHTTLMRGFSACDLAVFLADKLSWDRPGEPPYRAAVEAALAHSLEAAALAYIDYAMENGMILHPHRWLMDAREELRAV